MYEQDTNTIIWLYPQIETLEQIYFSGDDKIAAQIDSYRLLKDGWNYGMGVPPTEEIILKAKHIYFLSRLHGFEIEPHPDSDGGVSLICYLGGHSLEIEITNSQKYSVRYATGVADTYKLIWEKDIYLWQIEYELFEIEVQCKPDILLEPFTLNKTTLQDLKDSEVSEFLKNTKEEFQYSAKNAENTFPVEEYATI